MGWKGLMKKSKKDKVKGGIESNIRPDVLNVASSANSACVKFCRTGVNILLWPYTVLS